VTSKAHGTTGGRSPRCVLTKWSAPSATYRDFWFQISMPVKMCAHKWATNELLH